MRFAFFDVAVYFGTTMLDELLGCMWVKDSGSCLGSFELGLRQNACCKGVLRGIGVYIQGRKGVYQSTSSGFVGLLLRVASGGVEVDRVLR